MTEIEDLVARAKRSPDCVVLPPSSQPVVRAGDTLPPDVAELYRTCGGLELFARSEYPMRIVEPLAFARSNPAIAGVEAPDDITDSWYIIARGGPEEALSIDCHRDRLGRCYDSFWDRHGVAGSCPIIALSFTELLRTLLSARGRHLFWLAPEATKYGDAYGPA